ncbi:hypothetical protein CEXT_807251, partial [Caerostris extrusa]
QMQVEDQRCIRSNAVTRAASDARREDRRSETDASNSNSNYYQVPLSLKKNGCNHAFG